MKRYSQLLNELPAKKVVFAFGRFQPPTTGHELLVNAVKKIAAKQDADHVIFASRTHDKKSNPLPVDRKVYYLNRMFPKTNFVAANEEIRTFIEAAKMLSKKYKNLVMVAGSDRVPEYKKILEKYNGKEFNFDTIEVVSAGERDPDSDSASGMSGTKMREAAKDGDFALFKKGLPKILTELDGKRLMNEIRQGLGLDTIKEQVKFETSELREKYHAGEIFNVEDIVESAGTVYQIKKRGSNHLLLQDEAGHLVNKWLQDVQPTDKKFSLLEGLIEMKYTAADKIKVARIIASSLGIEDVEKSSNPEQLVNSALRKIRSKPMRPEYIDVLHKMLETAREAGIVYDEKLVPQKVNEAGDWDDMIKNLKKKAKAGPMKTVWDPVKRVYKNVPVSAPKQVKEATEDDLEKAVMSAKIASGLPFTKKPKDAVDVKNNQSDVAAVEEPKSVPGSEVGQSMTSSAESPAARKMKIRYVHEATDDAEQLQKKTEKANLVAKQAKEKEALAKKQQAERARLSESKKSCKEALGTEDDMDQYVPDDIGSGLTKTGMNKGGLREDEDIDVKKVDTDGDNIDDTVTDKEIEDLDKDIDDVDDILDVYDDDELAIIDADTGEHIEDLKEEVINEILSRAERIKAKTRFAKTKAKRERRTKIALKSRSDSTTINKRARKLAVQLMKQRIARKPLNKLSLAEKERLEKIIQRRKAVLNRLAMKLAPRVRKIENDRLAHRGFTK